MASRDKVVVDMFHKSIQYALEKLGKSKSGFERTVVSKFKRKRRVGSGNELVDYSRAPCLGADQKARGLWERDCKDVRAHCYCASLVRTLFIGHARATSFSSARTESKTRQNIELMTFALTWCANIFVGRPVTPTFFSADRFLF